jgi:hypothetical protein
MIPARGSSGTLPSSLMFPDHVKQQMKQQNNQQYGSVSGLSHASSDRWFIACGTMSDAFVPDLILGTTNL